MVIKNAQIVGLTASLKSPKRHVIQYSILAGVDMTAGQCYQLAIRDFLVDEIDVFY